MLCTKLVFVLYRLIGTDKPQVLEAQQSHFAPLQKKYADLGFDRVCWKSMLGLWKKCGANKKWDMEKTVHGQDLAQDPVKDQVQGLVQDLEPDIVFNDDHGI